MTSVAAGFVKAALRIYTLRYRVRQASLSRNVKYRYKAYRVPKGYSYEVTEYNGVKVEKLTPEKVLGKKIILQIHGGNGVGTVQLFDALGNLIDRIRAENIGCEYGEFDAKGAYLPAEKK